MMRLKILLTVLALALVFIFPQTAKARPLSVTDVEQRARQNFEDFFNAPAASCVPEHVSVKGVLFEDGRLYLNVSEDVLRYGGVFYEQTLLAGIAETAFALPDVRRVTVLVEGVLVPFTEGSEADVIKS